MFAPPFPMRNDLQERLSGCGFAYLSLVPKILALHLPEPNIGMAPTSMRVGLRSKKESQSPLLEALRAVYKLRMCANLWCAVHGMCCQQRLRK